MAAGLFMAVGFVMAVGFQGMYVMAAHLWTMAAARFAQR
jgi:hypothetical protein